MREVGIKWDIDSHVIIDGRYYFEPGHGDSSRRAASAAAWSNSCNGARSRSSMGVELRYESRVAKLARQRPPYRGRASCPIPTKNTKSGADSIILCAGGFQASAEMRARYLGSNADLMKVRGSKHDTGEVLMMAIDMGAKTAGHWQGAHATPIDATFPDVEISNKANRYGYTYGITVNSLGQRFFDEGEARHSYTYAKTGWAVLGQPGAVAYQIYDQKAIRTARHKRYYEFSTPIEAQHDR